MKRRLDKKELEMISGGFLIREQDGSYVIVGKSDAGFDTQMRFKKEDFLLAAEEDWYWFEKQHRARGIHSLGSFIESLRADVNVVR